MEEPKAPRPRVFNASKSIKSKLLKPAQTSIYEVHITPPAAATQPNGFFSSREVDFSSRMAELITLSCSDASLPGSSIATSEMPDKYHGSIHRYGYRRLYDDRADFTFYVDAPSPNNRGYNIIHFFENWLSYIAGEDSLRNQRSEYYTYRANYPENYRTEIYITKFEKDHNLKSIKAEEKQLPFYLEYHYVKAYPTSITSMPVSYEQSQLLKCTVSFTYLRYVMDRKYGIGEVENAEETPQGIARSNSRGFNIDGQIGDFFTPQSVPSVQSPAFSTPTTSGLA